MLVSTIVLTWNRREDTLACLRSVVAGAARDQMAIELVVIDNGSTDDTPDAVAEQFPAARLVRVGQNLGVPGGRNVGAAHSHGDVLLFIDNDATLAPGSLRAALDAFQADPSLGLLAARIERPGNGELDMACWVYGHNPRTWGQRAFETYTFAGAGFAVRRAAFEAVDGFWPDFFFAREEEDLAIRVMNAGYHVEYAPAMLVVHNASPQNRTRRARHLALSLGNSLLMYWRNLPLPLAIRLSLGKLLLFSVRCVQEGHPVAAPRGLVIALRKFPRAWRSRRCVAPATVASYRRLNPNAHPTFGAFRRRLAEVAIETGARAANQSWSAVHALEPASAPSNGGPQTMSADRPRSAVCIVRHNYYPDPQNHVRRDSQALVQAGYDVTVVSLRRPGQPWRELVNGVQVYRLPVVHRRGSVLRYFWEYAAFATLAFVAVSLLHIWKRFRVVEVDNMPDPLVFTALVPKLCGSRVVFYIFDNMPEMMMDSRRVAAGHPLVRLLLAAERIATSFADRVVVTQEMPRRLVLARGVPDGKLSVVLNCADDTLYRADVPRIRTRGPGSFEIVTHGAVLERYGIQTLIEALPIVAREVAEVSVQVFGAGEDRPRLEALAHATGVEDRVHFRGFVPMDELVRTLAQADAGYVGMLQDLALPNKLMEYVALGVPVVLSRWPTFEYYFPDDTATYFRTGDAADLAEKLIGIYRAPAAARARADRASELYRAYQWSVQRTRYLGMYADEVRRAGAEPPPTVDSTPTPPIQLHTPPGRGQTAAD